MKGAQIEKKVVVVFESQKKEEKRRKMNPLEIRVYPE